jgi:hypothetical protein
MKSYSQVFVFLKEEKDSEDILKFLNTEFENMFSKKGKIIKTKNRGFFNIDDKTADKIKEICLKKASVLVNYFSDSIDLASYNFYSINSWTISLESTLSAPEVKMFDFLRLCGMNDFLEDELFQHEKL